MISVYLLLDFGTALLSACGFWKTTQTTGTTELLLSARFPRKRKETTRQLSATCQHENYISAYKVLLCERNFVSLRSEIFVIIPTIIYIQNKWRMQ